MFNIGDTVLYGATGVCRVDGITEREIGGSVKKYFVLKPLAQDKCTVFVPADNEVLLSKVRKILSKDEILSVIDSLPEKEDIWVENENERRVRFSNIIHSGDRAELMLLIRTLYNKRLARRSEGKRLHIADERFLNEAERLLHDEFSAVLGVKPEEVVDFIIERIG